MQFQFKGYGSLLFPVAATAYFPYDFFSGDIRLANGSSAYEGRVEVFYNKTWGTVRAEYYLSINTAKVVCRQLGFTGAISVHRSAYFGHGSGLVLLSRVECQGNEARLSDCSHAGWNAHGIFHRDDDLGVVCSRE